MGKTYEQKERDRQRGVELRRAYTRWHREHPMASVGGGGQSPPHSSDPTFSSGSTRKKREKIDNRATTNVLPLMRRPSASFSLCKIKKAAGGAGVSFMTRVSVPARAR